jgi:hypothetical protein
MSQDDVKRTYDNLITEARKPMRERQRILQGRDGKTVAPRRHAISDEKSAEMKEEFKKTGIFQNPYQKGGKYHAFIEALVQLGIDQVHSFAHVKDKMKEILSKHIIKTKDGKEIDAWSDFEQALPREGASCTKDVRGRINDNACVLQRLNDSNPYGYKLAQIHACIDILKDNDGLPCFRLRTGFNNMDEIDPINELHRKRKPRKSILKDNFEKFIEEKIDDKKTIPVPEPTGVVEEQIIEKTE